MASLVEFNNNWKFIFQKEKERLVKILANERISTIEHIGATSVVLCGTFGTIDILCSLATYLDFVTVKNILVSKGYEYIHHLSDDFNCLFFVRRNEKRQIVATVRVVEYASEIYQQLILFRCYLKERNNTQKYNQLREVLLEKNDLRAYQKGKTDYIKYILDNFCHVDTTYLRKDDKK